MADLFFSMKDLYPTFPGASETSNMVNLDMEDREALTENHEAVETSSGNQSSTKNIFIAIGLAVAIIIFLGGE